jgi:hypothetical protein
VPQHLRARNSRGRLGLWALATVGLLAIAAFAVVALRLSRTPADSGAPSATSTEARTLGTEDVQVPGPWQVLKATDFAARRAGQVSFAVVDTTGALSCYRCRASYHSASVVKTMLLIAYLNRLAGASKMLDADHDAYLTSMIRVSDNAAATAIYAHVGDERLKGLARQAGMTNFDISGSWGSARVTAADQARLFSRMQELTPSEYQGYTRSLLASIVPRESWGIPEVSRPEWLTFFKGGWLSSRRGNLVHQVARLEKGEVSLTVAILTDRNPSDAYGRTTVRGIAARLLGE